MPNPQTSRVSARIMANHCVLMTIRVFLIEFDWKELGVSGFRVVIFGGLMIHHYKLQVSFIFNVNFYCSTQYFIQKCNHFYILKMLS